MVSEVLLAQKSCMQSEFLHMFASRKYFGLHFHDTDEKGIIFFSEV